MNSTNLMEFKKDVKKMLTLVNIFFVIKEIKMEIVDYIKKNGGNFKQNN